MKAVSTFFKHIPFGMIFLLLGSCALPTPTAPPLTSLPDQSETPGYPGPPTQVAVGYPVPELTEDPNKEPFINAPATFTADTGAFQITLYYPGGERPVRSQTFYAAELLPVTGELEGSYIPAVDTTTAPRGGSDDNGFVTFSNVPPGKYALVAMTPLGPVLLIDPNTEENITFEIIANQLTQFEPQEVFLNPEAMEP